MWQTQIGVCVINSSARWYADLAPWHAGHACGKSLQGVSTDTLTNEILQALLVAPDDNKQRALQSLRGELPPAAPSPTRPLLLTMGDAADLLGVCRSTLWRMIRRKKLIPIEIMPGTFRVRRVDIDRIAGVAS